MKLKHRHANQHANETRHERRSPYTSTEEHRGTPPSPAEPCRAPKSTAEHNRTPQGTAERRRTLQGTAQCTARWRHSGDTHALIYLQALQNSQWHGCSMSTRRNLGHLPNIVLVVVALVILGVDLMLNQPVEHVTKAVKFHNEIVPWKASSSVLSRNTTILEEEFVAMGVHGSSNFL